MFRLISWLIYEFTSQQKRESSDYLWMVYEKVKYSQKKWIRNLYGCILHRIFRENGANIPKRNLKDIRYFRMDRVGYIFRRARKLGKIV